MTDITERPTVKFFSEWHIARRGEQNSYADVVAPAIKCRDGSELSVQASQMHYCTPRETMIGNDEFYTAYEVYDFENEDEPRGWVPAEEVIDMIMERGGPV